MDAFSGYNQISTYKPDEEHTSFITDYGLYYYKAMSFSLKNIGVTYQRLVYMMFKNLMEKTIELYMDDMLVKSRMARDNIERLRQMFNVLQKYQMNLNPLKCTFRIGS